MATARQTRLPPAERRELVLEAAGRLFGERGYAHTSLDQIAAAAGVTKPILYRHFDSKKALYLALLERHRDDLPRFFERVPAGLSFDERVEAILEVWFDYVSEHGYAWRMLFRDAGGDEEIRAFRRANYDRAREVLATFIRGPEGNPETGGRAACRVPPRRGRWARAVVTRPSGGLAGDTRRHREARARSYSGVT